MSVDDVDAGRTPNLLDTRTRTSTEQLLSAIFDWIEGSYNPRRRHSSLGMLSPAQFESLAHPVAIAA